MKIHEYQAQKLFRDYLIPTQNGVVFTQKSQTYDLSSVKPPYVIKAQIHSGGRGKAGGVKVCKDLDSAYQTISNMLGNTLYTKQVPQGKVVNKVYVVDGVNLEKEIYLSMTIDAKNESVAVIASKSGGTEIEEIALKDKNAIVTVNIPYENGLQTYHALEIAKKIDVYPQNYDDFCALLKNMYRLFMEKDCSLVEINPLIEYEAGGFLAVDAKINFDDNALFRHKDIVELRDELEEDQKELEASKFDLNFVTLDGNIGCLVNGAGLAMATMDTIKAFGGEPANFLDVGGSATTEKVSAAFKILLSDKNVKAILVNIFGGIMKCDVIAQGIVEATKNVGLNIPLIVRLDGTNVEKGKEIINSSNLNIVAADNMKDAVLKAVNSIGGEK
ncbi:MAG: ADP-forming succinate--CoA ligase subunit beta [Clostridia bacterium]|nr:ADP-forming succinate--CoA ligase subunit beta [Clostridia bacterium]